MYDPDVVDAFIRFMRTSGSPNTTSPDAPRVLQQINRSLQGHPPPSQSPRRRVPAWARRTKCSRSSAWLASRKATGSTADVLALSTTLLWNIAPGASGAWFIVGDTGEHLSVAEAFGPAGLALRKSGDETRRKPHRLGGLEPSGHREFGCVTRPGRPRGRIDAAARQLPERAAGRRPDARGRADDVRAGPRRLQGRLAASSRWWRRTSQRHSMQREGRAIASAAGRASARPEARGPRRYAVRTFRSAWRPSLTLARPRCATSASCIRITTAPVVAVMRNASCAHGAMLG